ncbi:MAG: ABC transporter ATP-binding protein [Thermotogaceae bacterium]|nr:ABC transporter ATP-binding protein [Thermotogaceae bacterium]
MIEVKNVAKSFGTTIALVDVSFSVAESSVFVLIGPNGAGKTTVMRCMIGELKPDKGSIFVNSSPLNIEAKKHMAMMLEERQVFDKMTGSEHAKVWSMMYKSWNDSRFKDLVLHFRLPMDKRVSEYSIGMKTLLFFILTVSTDSKILILDEPTQHLDPVWKDDVLSIIRSYAQRGNTIILSTHQVEEAELMATHFAIIRSGRVLYSDELDAAKENHRVVRVEEMEEELEQITVMNNDTVLVKTNKEIGRYPTFREIALGYLRSKESVLIQ